MFPRIQNNNTITTYLVDPLDNMFELSCFIEIMFTEYCKKISKREALGEDVSDIESGSSEDEDKAFHHPFQVRDRPNSIVMNIRVMPVT